MNADPENLAPPLRARLDRLGRVRSTRDLVGGRGGRTFAVEHESAGPGLTTVVHVRGGGPEAVRREAAAAGAAYAAGVGPEVLDVAPSLGVLVTRWIPGTALRAQDLADAAVRVQVGRAVAALHAAPVPAELPRLDPAAVRRGYLDRFAAAGRSPESDVLAEGVRTDALVAALDAAADAAAPVLCHGDLVPANILATGPRGTAVLDYEYAGAADPGFDLGGLAATAELTDPQVVDLVAGYAAAGGSATATPERVLAWRDVTRHAWFVWVALGTDLGPEAQRWTAWAARSRAAWAGGSGRPG